MTKMAESEMDNNKALLSGTVSSPMSFSHMMYGEGFYTFKLAVSRLREYVDLLPITVSERLLNGRNLTVGANVIVEGQLRSYNKFIDGANRLILTIFTRDLYFKDEDEYIQNPNQIYLNGFLCKPPIYRVTPFKREIADLLIAVNRPYNKSDYIPAISWGRNARFSQTLNVGDAVAIWGRIQSRPYQKKLDEGQIIERVAYEVSVSKMESVKK